MKWNSQAFRLAAYCKLCAAGVNDQGLLRRELIEQFQNFADRSRQYDEVRVIGSRAIHYLQLLRSVEHRRFIDTCDTDLRETTFKRQTQRSADQTDAKDCDPLGKLFHFTCFPFPVRAVRYDGTPQ